MNEGNTKAFEIFTKVDYRHEAQRWLVYGQKFLYKMLLEGEQKKSLLAFLSLEAIS